MHVGQRDYDLRRVPTRLSAGKHTDMANIRPRVVYFTMDALVVFTQHAWRDVIKKRSDDNGEEQVKALPAKWPELERGFPARKYALARMPSNTLAMASLSGSWI